MQGKIIKGIAGFYYVHVVDKGIYESKAKGAFRNERIKPLVGDNVEIDIIDENAKIGNIKKILKRKNSLIRPAVANINQAMIVFALKDPDPALNLLDRFLILMEMQGVKTVICFNKSDLVTELSLEESSLKTYKTGTKADQSYVEYIASIYEKAGYEVIITSTKEGENIDLVKKALKSKTTAFAGPSGVGKSSMLNAIMPEAESETGEISKKLGRGKHTTRHSEIFNLEGDTYIMDTPGFSSLDLSMIKPEELKNYYPEFVKEEDYCKFAGCLHLNEPVCGVKDALEEGRISLERYENYKLLYEELKQIKRY